MAYRQPPWIAKVVKDGKQVTIGRFETREEAEQAEHEFKLRHHLPLTRKEISAKAHATMFNLGTHRNQHTVGKEHLRAGYNGGRHSHKGEENGRHRRGSEHG